VSVLTSRTNRSGKTAFRFGAYAGITGLASDAFTSVLTPLLMPGKQVAPFEAFITYPAQECRRIDHDAVYKSQRTDVNVWILYVENRGLCSVVLDAVREQFEMPLVSRLIFDSEL